jgi:cell division inhibitor SulA
MKQLSIYDQDLHHQNYQLITQTATSCRHLRIQPEVTAPEVSTKVNLTTETNPAISPKPLAPNVTEIVLTKGKIDSIQLILPMLISLHQEKRWLAWIDPPIQLLKEWKKAHNEKTLNEVMILRSNENFSVFELSKRALEAGTCHAVIAWTDSLSQDEFSKLEAASSSGNSHGIILRSRSLASM